MSSELDIVYYLSQFPKTSETFVLNEVHELERRGHSVSVFSLKRPDTDVTHTEYGELDVREKYLPSPSFGSATTVLADGLPSSSLIGDSIRDGRIERALGNMYIRPHFERFLREVDPDLVHSHFVNWPRLAAQSAASALDIPFTVTAHAHGLFRNGGTSTKRLLEKADRVLTISEYNRQYIRDTYVRRDDIGLVRMGIREGKFSPTDGTCEGRILTVARFVEKKGLKYALDAIAELSIDDVELRLVGEGPLGDSLRERVERLGIADRVEFLGRLPDQELIEEYDRADVFLLPCVEARNGDRDGIPVSLMEAMAMRTVPVSTAVSGIPELISHGRNGYLGRPRHTGSLVTALRNALDNGTRSDVREAARATVLRSFVVETTVSDLVAQFESVTKRHSL